MVRSIEPATFQVELQTLSIEMQYMWRFLSIGQNVPFLLGKHDRLAMTFQETFPGKLEPNLIREK